MKSTDTWLLIQYDVSTSPKDAVVPTGLVAEASYTPGTEVPGYSQASLAKRIQGVVAMVSDTPSIEPGYSQAFLTGRIWGLATLRPVGSRL